MVRAEGFADRRAVAVVRIDVAGHWSHSVTDARLETALAARKKAHFRNPGTMRVPDQHDSTDCRAVADVLARVGDKWTVMVVAFLSAGPMRFNELRRTIGGISQRMLTLTLRGLERDGLVTRTVTPSIPPRVDYELTELGRTLIVTLGELSDWAIRNRLQVEEARRRFDGRDETRSSGTPADRVAASPPTR